MNKNNDEIDLIKLLKKIYKEKTLVFKITIVFAFFGIFQALILPNKFTSSTTFIPQLSSGIKSGNSLSGLASFVGINLGNNQGSSEFPPTLYPQVLNGIPFKLELLSSKIKINNKLILVKDYFSEKHSSIDILATLKKYTIGLPSLLIGSIKKKDVVNVNSEIYTVTEEDKGFFDLLSSDLYLSINDVEGFITISYTDENKNVAAQITQIAQNLLQKKIIEFKNQSSKELLDFAMKQYDEKKNDYEKLQDQRAVFVDKNLNISSSLFQNKLSRLENELSISQSIVQQLASQVEQAKLQVNKDTPVFTTIQPVTIPYKRSSPDRMSIVLVFAFSGILITVLYLLIKEPLIEIFKSVKS